MENILAIVQYKSHTVRYKEKIVRFKVVVMKNEVAIVRWGQCVKYKVNYGK